MATNPTPLSFPGDQKRVVIGIKVKFELNSADGLRRVIFGLEKDTQGDQIDWKIQFELFEREKNTDDYSDALVDLEVEVDTALHDQAETTAHNGMTPLQTAHALGPAADDAKAADAGDIDQEDANETIQATLSKG
jgi:hypothetical protein